MTDKQVANYYLLEKLGCGAYGCVYKGQHVHISDRFVAVKIFLGDVEEDNEQSIFNREARALNKARHPHILPVLDCGVFTSWVGTRSGYLITELASGGSLLDRLKSAGILPFDQSLSIILQIAEGLQHAHEQQVIHRDLKPANILFDDQDNILIADFGIAVILTSERTKQGIVVGTFEYMAPEQFDGTISPKSDQYALACIAYELFTGQRPFSSNDRSVLMHHHLEVMPMSPETLNPSLPRSAGRVLLKALSKDRNDRYATVIEFSEALRMALSPPSTRAMRNLTWSDRTYFPDLQSPDVDVIPVRRRGHSLPPIKPLREDWEFFDDLAEFKLPHRNGQNVSRHPRKSVVKSSNVNEIPLDHVIMPPIRPSFKVDPPAPHKIVRVSIPRVRSSSPRVVRPNRPFPQSSRPPRDDYSFILYSLSMISTFLSVFLTDISTLLLIVGGLCLSLAIVGLLRTVVYVYYYEGFGPTIVSVFGVSILCVGILMGVVVSPLFYWIGSAPLLAWCLWYQQKK